MKKKILALILCFTLIFSSLNIKRSYADGGVISLPILATVSALAVGTGIIINSDDDLYDLGTMFYNYVDNHNDLTWSALQTAFAASVSLHTNKLISVKSDFLDIVKGFFDSTFGGDTFGNISIDTSIDIPISIFDVFTSFSFDRSVLSNGSDSEYHVLNLTDNYRLLYRFRNYYNNLAGNDITFNYQFQYLNDSGVWASHWSSSTTCRGLSSNWSNGSILKLYRNGKFGYYILVDGSIFLIDPIDTFETKMNSLLGSSSSVSFPYSGGYTWDNVESKKDNESVALPVPGDLGQLVGQGSTDFWNNTNDLVGQGGLALPEVENPSISVDTSVNTFPSVDVPDTDLPGVESPSVPNEGIWATIKDFIIGLVVPSDTYWTDTWGGLYNNFTNSFPMVDMDGFNDLVTGEKKFPNIDINIMGVSGRVVNGDVVNSIVDWFRPIIAGFMMLCLMLFNYRKIYKLIRNSDPFGGIASGTSDFRTGISEYSKEPVIKAVDMNAEYQAWKARGGK